MCCTLSIDSSAPFLPLSSFIRRPLGQNNDLASRSERRLFLCRDEILAGVFCFTMGRGPCNLPACCARCSNVISWIFLQRESSCTLRRLIKAGVSLGPRRRDGGDSSGPNHHSALIGWVSVKWPPALGMGHCNPPLCPTLARARVRRRVRIWDYALPKGLTGGVWMDSPFSRWYHSHRA